MIAGITSLRFNGAAFAGCGRVRLEDNWGALDRWPFSNDQFDIFRLALDAVYRAVEQVDGGPERIIKYRSYRLPWMNSLAFSAAPIACFMAVWLKIAAALSCDAKARRARGPHQSTSAAPKGISFPKAVRVATGGSRGRLLSSVVNILKQAPARWMRPGSENRGPTLILLRERSKPAETLPGLA
ncbi:hypothetical protein [Bradyrhizobium cajani]|uniref:Uncharacterized protein n=1 Tax=Bradyrhizobium cajani TaxID=1928661 RepID=A0A844T5C8_9BRAD|nr:hypothetical protein [Bradyrhizobium cajani]MCP3368781.1 hypothetical protein [Bradyrhizobium cajani]MVT73436.1 hypothetical protein [Bradyrhizobium cajani]